jgi:transposase-like protein
MSESPKNINLQAGPKIRSYSEATRKSHVSNWRASGLSLSRYSLKQGISVSALSKWVKNYADKHSETPFKAVSLENGTLNCQLSYGESLIEIRMPNGTQLKVPFDGKINWPELLGVILHAVNFNQS